MIMKFKGKGITIDAEVEVSIIKSVIPLNEKMKCMRSARGKALSTMCHYHHVTSELRREKVE